VEVDRLLQQPVRLGGSERAAHDAVRFESMSSPRPLVVAAAGIAALCALDATVKELTRSYAVAYAVLGRYVFGTVFALAVWWWQGRPRLTRDMVPAHLTRGILIAVTAFLFFFSFTRLGMAEAITLSFIAPLLIPPLAHLLLGERMRGPVLLATLLGFAGVLITVQGAPSFGGPRGLCFAGCLPPQWHREDETPGIDIVMRGLAPSSRPHHIEAFDVSGRHLTNRRLFAVTTPGIPDGLEVDADLLDVPERDRRSGEAAGGPGERD